MTDLDIRIAELRQLCANPSDGLTGGDWCQAANEAVEIILSLEEQLEALRQAEEAARTQDRIGNEGDADAIRRDALRRLVSNPAKRPT